MIESIPLSCWIANKVSPMAKGMRIGRLISVAQECASSFGCTLFTSWTGFSVTLLKWWANYKRFCSASNSMRLTFLSPIHLVTDHFYLKLPVPTIQKLCLLLCSYFYYVTTPVTWAMWPPLLSDKQQRRSMSKQDYPMWKMFPKHRPLAHPVTLKLMGTIQWHPWFSDLCIRSPSNIVNIQIVQMIFEELVLHISVLKAKTIQHKIRPTFFQPLRTANWFHLR